MAWTADQVLEFLAAHQTTLQRFGVEKIGLFGSYRRGEARPDSDMDFLVRMSTPNYYDFLHLRRFLEESFGCPIDLGEEDYLREELSQTILEEVIYVEGL